jgi:DNA-binding response OmpR family regulator
VLVVGDDPITGELVPALGALGLRATAARTAEGVHAVVSEAPDLVLLAGSPRRSASALLQPLTDDPSSAVVPVVLLGDTAEVQARAPESAFDHGVVGRVQRDLGVELIAREVRRIVDELPDRPSETHGVVAEATLDQLVDLLSTELQSGILSVSGQREARIVLRHGQAVGERMEDFVERVKPLLDDGSEARFAFQAHATGRLDSVPPARGEPTQRVRMGLRGRRLLVIHREREAAEAWAAALRRCGAEVVVLSDHGELARARALDPQVVVVEPAALEGQKHALVRAVQRDDRLRWAGTLLAPAPALEHPERDELYLDALIAKVRELCASHDALKKRLRDSERFETRLELIGPAQLLRMLVDQRRTLALHVQHPNAVLDLWLIDGEIAEARAVRRDRGTERLDGQEALALLLSLRRGRITGAPATSPSVVHRAGGLSLDPGRLRRPSPVPSSAPSPLLSSIPPPPALPSGPGVRPLRGERGDPLMLGLALTAMAAGLAGLVVYIIWL